MAVAKMNAAVQKIGTGADLREEMALTVGPNFNWEEFLVPAPMCISLLGELICISTTTDFSLEKKPPKDGFKLLKWPNSFRASLVQVSNAGYDAFNAAHKNMDQIRLLTANVPGNLKDAVTIIMKGSNEELEDMLPIPLNAIEHTAEQCLALAESVEKKYIDVMDLTAELLEASVSSRGGYEQELQETKIALAIAKENKKTAAEQKEMAKQSYVELEKAVKKAEDSYYKAMDSMPSGWDMIGMNVVEGLANSFTSAMDGAVNFFTFGGSGKKKKSKGKENKSGDAEEKPGPSVGPSLSRATRDAYNLAIKIQIYTDSLAAECVDVDGNLKKSLQQIIERIMYVEQRLRFCLQEATNIAAAKDAVKDRVVALCIKGVKVCTEVKEMSKSIHHNAEEAKTVAEKITTLQEDVMSLSSEGNSIIGSSPTATKGPNQRTMKMTGNEDASAAQQAVQNGRFQIEQSSANLEHTREKYDKACDKMMETSKKLGEILGEISKLDMTKLDFEKIRKTLIMGIKAIGQLREEWAKIVMFFTMMSNIIKCSLNTSLKDFLKYVDTTQEHSLRGYPISSLKRDMIYQQAFQSAKIAYVVNMISGTYVEVSKTYLMDRLAGLGGMLGYDPETQASAIARERQKLFQDMANAQLEIRELVKKRKAEFDRQIASRINKIRGKLEAAMPVESSSSHETKRIQEAVQRGMEHVKQETKEELATSGMDVDDFI